MAQTPIHMLGDLLGIKNFTPPTPLKAHFTLESSGYTYILDAEIKNEWLWLSLSRQLLAYENDDQKILQAAAHIAENNAPTRAYHMHSTISFVQQLPLTATMNMLEKSLDTCIQCQEALRNI